MALKTVHAGRPYKVYATVFLLALAFWVVVKLNKDYNYTVEIPLKVILNSDEKWLKYPTPQKVRAEFLGRGMDLLQLNFTQPVYEIDLSEEQGKFTLNLSEHWEYVKLPEDLDVKVNSIMSPHEITFEFDKRSQRKIPVTVQTRVKTRDGFTLVSGRARPDSVLVTGPASLVDTLTHLKTLEKSYTDVDRSFSDVLEIKKNRRFYYRCQPPSVDVEYDVQRLAEKHISDVAVKVINSPQKLEVVPLPSTATVYVKGGEKILGEADAGNFVVAIDFAREWKPGVSRVPGNVQTDLHVLYTESKPSEFDLIVQKRRQ